MNRRRAIAHYAAVIALLLVMGPGGGPAPAFAYIDPGLGTTIVTTILGLVAAIGYIFRSTLAKLRRFFARDSSDHGNR